jgi:hypothetical protein
MHVLVASLQQPHDLSGKAKLTVCGRALCKHSHRAESETVRASSGDSTCPWPVAVGSEDKKNALALEASIGVLSRASWVNIFKLPHDIITLEVRDSAGYGLRWTCSDEHVGASNNDRLQTPSLSCCYTFRGFVEPAMEGGHENRWRH